MLRWLGRLKEASAIEVAAIPFTMGAGVAAMTGFLLCASSHSVFESESRK